MSWLDNISNIELQIRTGDGLVYKPLWKEAKKSRGFNTSSFNFIGIEGTLVDRRMAEGDQYDLVLYFTGDDHLVQADNFNISANDKRYWTITHPFYGVINVQPISLEDDRTQLNATIFRIKVWETLTSAYPVEKKQVVDVAEQNLVALSDTLEISFENEVPIIDSALRTSMDESIDILDELISSVLVSSSDFGAFKTKVSQAKKIVNDSLSASSAAMRSIIDLIGYPARTIQDVTGRLSVLEAVSDELEANILGVSGGNVTINAHEAVFLEACLSVVVGACAYSVVSPSDQDYKVRSEVLSASDRLRESYEHYLELMDQLQSLRSDDPESFLPDDESNRTLNDTVYEALCNLYDTAFEAKQERIMHLDYDSNPIVLAHRLYGLDENDTNLNMFIDTNSLSMDELIQISAGRRLVYYV